MAFQLKRVAERKTNFLVVVAFLFPILKHTSQRYEPTCKIYKIISVFTNIFKKFLFAVPDPTRFPRMLL